MHDSSLVWRKHGDIFAHECVPEWKFGGKAIFMHDILQQNRWQSTTNRAFTPIELMVFSKSLGTWDKNGQLHPGHNKCLSGGTIRRIQVIITNNTIPHNLIFSLYQDQTKQIKEYFTLEASSGLHVESIDTFDHLIFDHRYAYAWTTDDGTIPALSDSNQTIGGWISTEVDFGG